MYCGACEPECPVEAIFPEEALPEKWVEFTSINAGWNESSGHLNGLVDRYLEEHELPPIAGQRS